MATFYSNTSRYTRLRVDVNPDSPDIANNRTYVRVTVYIVTGTYSFAGEATGSVSVAGTSIWSAPNSNYSSNKTHQVATNNFYVSHSSDGTKSIPISGSYSSNSGGYGPVSLSISTTMTLPTIPRGSPINNFLPFNIGSNVYWGVDRKSPGFTHWVRLSFAGTQIYDEGGWSGASGTITITNAMKLKMLNHLSPNYDWDWAELTVWTYSSSSQTSGNLVGVDTKTVKATGLAADLAPTANFPTVTKAGDFVEWGNNEIENYVQGKSKAKVVSSATGKYGATIAEYRIRIDDKNYYGSNITTGYLNVIGQRHIQLRVTDSRGFTDIKTDTTSVYVYEYYTPKVNRFNVERLTAETDVKISYQWLMSSINGENYKYLWLQYRKEGEVNWRTTYLESRTPTAYTETKTLNKYGIIDGDNTWEFRLWIRDSYSDTFIIETVGSAFQLTNWNASGKGIAFGEVSSSNNFSVAMPADFKNSLISNSINGTLMYENGSRLARKIDVDSKIVSGTSGDWNYIKFANGTMILDGRFYNSIAVGTAWGSLYYSSTWQINFPTAHKFLSAPTVTSSWTSTDGDAFLLSRRPATTSHAGDFYLLRPKSGSVVGYTQVIAIGRWKS